MPGLRFDCDIGEHPEPEQRYADTLTLDNFIVQEGSEIATAHDGMTRAIGYEDGIVVTRDLNGSRISVSYGGKTHTLSAFQFRHTVDTATWAYTRFSEGILDGSNHEGVMTFRTPILFQGLAFQYTHTGEMLIEGTEGASLRLLAPRLRKRTCRNRWRWRWRWRWELRNHYRYHLRSDR